MSKISQSLPNPAIVQSSQVETAQVSQKQVEAPSLDVKGLLLNQVSQQAERRNEIAPSTLSSQSSVQASPKSRSVMQAMLSGSLDVQSSGELAVSVSGHEIVTSDLTTSDDLAKGERKLSMMLDGKGPIDISMSENADGATRYYTGALPYQDFNSLQELAEGVVKNALSVLPDNSPDELNVSVPGHKIDISLAQNPASLASGERRLSMLIDGKGPIEISAAPNSDGTTRYHSNALPYQDFGSLQELTDNVVKSALNVLPTDLADVSVSGHQIDISLAQNPANLADGEQRLSMNIDGKGPVEISVTKKSDGSSRFSASALPYQDFSSLQELAEGVVKNALSVLPSNELNISVPGHQIDISLAQNPASLANGERRLSMLIDGKGPIEINASSNSDGTTRYHSNALPYQDFGSLQELTDNVVKSALNVLPTDLVDVSVSGHQIDISLAQNPANLADGEQRLSMSIDGKGPVEISVTKKSDGSSRFSASALPYQDFNSLQELAEGVVKNALGVL